MTLTCLRCKSFISSIWICTLRFVGAYITLFFLVITCLLTNKYCYRTTILELYLSTRHK